MRTTISRAATGRACFMAGVAVMAFAIPAQAQEAAPSRPTAPAPQPIQTASASADDIIVTATRRATSVQDVPFSIMAVGGPKLEQANVDGLTALTTLVPGLQRPGGAAGALSLRGGYGSSGFPGVDQDVGLYIDDVAVSGLADMNQEYFDIQRVEVLRGPQGTLFGRNVTGGAVAIHTREPSFTPELKVRLGYGNYDDYKAQAFATGPLSETLAYKLVVSATGHDGYLRNETVGGRTGDTDTQSVRGALLYEPDDGTKILLAADGYRRNADAVSQLIGTAQPGLIWPTFSFDKDVSSQFLGDEYPNGFVRQRQANVMARAEFDLGFATLTSIFSYRRLNSRDLTAGVGDPLNSDPVRSTSRYRQFTAEARLASPSDRAFRWVAGLYYLDGYRFFEVAPFPDYRMFGPPYGPSTVPSIANLLAGQGYFQPNSFYRQTNYSGSKAIFGEANLDLTDSLTATIGGRYTWEEKHGFSDRSNTVAYLVGPPISAFYKANWSAFTPKGTLTFKPSDAIMFYATVARGFKSGAFDASTPSTVIGLQTPSNPTYVWNYEAGLKSTLFNGDLTANASLFRMDYTDLQVAIFDPIAVGFAFKNAGEARDQGLELELAGKPFPWLHLGLSYTYQDAHYRNYVIENTPPAPPTVNSGNRMIQTPKHALSLSLDTNWDAGDSGSFSFGGSVLFRGKMFFSDTNSDPDYIHDHARINGLVDLHAAWTSPDKSWEIALWGRNVTNHRYIYYSVDVSSLYRPATDPLPNSIRLVSWNAPRTYGLVVTRRF